ncbi:8121_t:CDS:2, partial [Entrophospora sp. SA101]
FENVKHKKYTSNKSQETTRKSKKSKFIPELNENKENIDISEFMTKFEAMDDEHKWKLLLCSETKNIFSNSLLHSFVINIDDPKIKEIFNEIKNISLKSDPEPSEMFKVELNNLCKTTTIEIQDALNKLHTKISTSNEADKFPLDTFHYAVKLAHLLVHNIKIVLDRTIILGKKWDQGSEHGTKWLAESGLKLSKSLRDMLVELNKQVVDISEKIEIVGFVKGIVYEIPVDIINFHKALDLIGAVWILKILRTIKLTQQPKSNLAVAIRKKETRKQNHY